jgi:hypothetical protein
MRSGRRPRVRPPDTKPIEKPTASSTASLAIARLRSVRTSRVSRPWIVLASAQRCRPASVLGPVLRPPCVLHTRLPLRAGAAHCSFVRLDFAWQRWQVTRPPSVMSICSKCKVWLDTIYTLWEACLDFRKIIENRTSWEGYFFSQPRHWNWEPTCKNTYQLFKNRCHSWLNAVTLWFNSRKIKSAGV